MPRIEKRTLAFFVSALVVVSLGASCAVDDRGHGHEAASRSEALSARPAVVADDAARAPDDPSRGPERPLDPQAASLARRADAMAHATALRTERKVLQEMYRARDQGTPVSASERDRLNDKIARLEGRIATREARVRELERAQNP